MPGLNLNNKFHKGTLFTMYIFIYLTRPFLIKFMCLSQIEVKQYSVLADEVIFKHYKKLLMLGHEKR